MDVIYSNFLEYIEQIFQVEVVRKGLWKKLKFDFGFERENEFRYREGKNILGRYSVDVKKFKIYLEDDKWIKFRQWELII